MVNRRIVLSPTLKTTFAHAPAFGGSRITVSTHTEPSKIFWKSIFFLMCNYPTTQLPFFFWFVSSMNFNTYIDLCNHHNWDTQQAFKAEFQHYETMIMCKYLCLASSWVNHGGITEYGVNGPCTIMLCFPTLGCKLPIYVGTDIALQVIIPHPVLK